MTFEYNIILHKAEYIEVTNQNDSARYQVIITKSESFENCYILYVAVLNEQTASFIIGDWVFTQPIICDNSEVQCRIEINGRHKKNDEGTKYTFYVTTSFQSSEKKIADLLMHMLAIIGHTSSIEFFDEFCKQTNPRVGRIKRSVEHPIY